jgi:hypothetical protein
LFAEWSCNWFIRIDQIAKSISQEALRNSPLGFSQAVEFVDATEAIESRRNAIVPMNKIFL